MKQVYKTGMLYPPIIHAISDVGNYVVCGFVRNIGTLKAISHQYPLNSKREKIKTYVVLILHDQCTYFFANNGKNSALLFATEEQIKHAATG